MKLTSGAAMRSSQSGFALPIAVGLGLIAILVGITAILRAQDDRTIAINSSASLRSQMATNAGITQAQSFINRYRMLANYNACNSDDWASNGSCNNSGSNVADRSWGNPDSIPNLNAVCGTGSLSASQNAVRAWTSNTWKPVDTSSPPDLSLGEYRLVTYDNSGVLSVEGVTNRGESNESKYRVSVDIPIFSVDNEQAAGLWVQSNGSGNPNISTDVIAPCSASNFLGSSSTGELIKTQVAMPSAPAQPPIGETFYSLPDISSILGDNVQDIQDGQTVQFVGKKLPRLISNGTGVLIDDLPDSNGEYNYVIDSLDDSFEIVPGKKVNLWVNGLIDLRNTRIINPCGAPGSDSSCGPFDVKIYGSGSGNQITMDNGTLVCDIFFHLPNHTLTFSSSGTPIAPDCGSGATNTSIFWVNTWSGSGVNTASWSPRARWSDFPSNLSLELPPRIGIPSEWEPE